MTHLTGFDPDQTHPEGNWAMMEETMMDHGLTITYRGHTFRIFAFRVEDGWTEAVFELLREGETAEWDGSGLHYGSVNECLAVTVQDILDTVDEPAEDAGGEDA